MITPQRKIHASHAHRQAAYRRRCQEAQQRQLQEKGLPALPAIPTIPGTPRWRQAIAKAAELLCAVRHVAPCTNGTMVAQEMESYFADRMEEWQEGERAESFQGQFDAICEARDMVAELTGARRTVRRARTPEGASATSEVSPSPGLAYTRRACLKPRPAQYRPSAFGGDSHSRKGGG